MANTNSEFTTQPYRYGPHNDTLVAVESLHPSGHHKYMSTRRFEAIGELLGQITERWNNEQLDSLLGDLNRANDPRSILNKLFDRAKSINQGDAFHELFEKGQNMAQSHISDLREVMKRGYDSAEGAFSVPESPRPMRVIVDGPPVNGVPTKGKLISGGLSPEGAFRHRTGPIRLPHGQGGFATFKGMGLMGGLAALAIGVPLLLGSGDANAVPILEQVADGVVSEGATAGHNLGYAAGAAQAGNWSEAGEHLYEAGDALTRRAGQPLGTAAAATVAGLTTDDPETRAEHFSIARQEGWTAADRLAFGLPGAIADASTPKPAITAQNSTLADIERAQEEVLIAQFDSDLAEQLRDPANLSALANHIKEHGTPAAQETLDEFERLEQERLYALGQGRGIAAAPNPGVAPATVSYTPG